MARKNAVRNGLARPARALHGSHPLAAGFRPAGAALALAAAFGFASQPGHAQPVPLQVIHGSATFTSSGSNLQVTTTNGAGTNHSAIDWRSFSVPAGSVTEFIQPTATSTSINRVVEANPSAILGRLASNGRLVLVNPWGITVGGTAVVDTAGFTASTLAMTDLDAKAGVLRFAGPGAALSVETGAVIRGTGGDVVLIAPDVQVAQNALVQSDGATLLLAGQKVEITGRGLEGILMEVQAGDRAVNLGTLKGDAVGIFAGTLKHSGLVQANAVTVQGGKVLLTAQADAVVDGKVEADSDLTIRAGGDVGFGSASLSAHHAPIAVVAGGSITGAARFETHGSAAGTVSLEAGTGGISFDAIDTSACTCTDVGGAVTLRAKGAISGGAIETTGRAGGGAGAVSANSGQGSITLDAIEGRGGDNASGPGGQGATVLLEAAGDVKVRSIDVSSGASAAVPESTAAPVPVAGGSVTISSSGGNIEVGTITARGSAGTGVDGGAGGTVILSALATAAGQGTIHLAGSVLADGGGSDAAKGGAGGSIKVEAANEILSTQVDAAQLAARGGDSALGTGGRGGDVTLTTTVGSIHAPGATLEASGGAGQAGGHGGELVLDAARDAEVALLNARGGLPLAAKPLPGDGGSVDVRVGGVLEVPEILAEGHTGGTVGITFTGASGTLEGVNQVLARGEGGEGGSISVSGDALTVGGGTVTVKVGAAAPVTVPRFVLLDASGTKPPAPSASPTTVPSTTAPAASTGAPAATRGVRLSGRSSLQLRNVVLEGDARAVASEGTVRTAAGTFQGWTLGQGLHIEGRDGVTLESTLGAIGNPDSALSLHALHGDIVQTGGLLFAEAVIAQADAGQVRLVQPNVIGTVAGSASGRFDVVSGLGAIAVGALGTPFASATGISGDAGVSVRSRGDIVVLAPVRSSTGAVALTAGDSTVPLPSDIFGSVVGTVPATLIEAAPTADATLAAITLPPLPALPGASGAVQAFSTLAAGTDIVLQGSDVSGAAGRGVLLQGAALQAGGSIDVTGSSKGLVGIEIDGSQIATAGGSAAFHSPQTVLFSASTLDTHGGALTIDGGSATHAGIGVQLTQGSSLHAGAGRVTMRGDSHDAAGFVLESVGGGRTVSGGDVSITGSTVTSSAALVVDGETVGATDAITLDALGGALQIRNGSTISNTGTGGVLLRSTGGASGTSLLSLSADSKVLSAGDIQLVADSFDLQGLLSGARTLVRPLDTARRILVNGSDANALNFTQAQLDAMGSNIVLGDLSLTGGISVEAPTTLRTGTTLSLLNGGAIGQQAGALLTTTNLYAEGSSVALHDVSIGSGTGGTLAGRAHAGDFRVVNTQAVPAPLRIGAVNGASGVSASGNVFIRTPGLLQLSAPVASSAPGNAITLAAGDLLREGAGALSAANGRWLVYLRDVSSNLATGPQSANFALWGRSIAADPPETVTEAGNRYLFERRPVVDVAAQATTRTYDGSVGFGTLGFTPSGLVDAASVGNVFLQDSFSGALAVPTATKNVGSYGIERGTLQAPAGYAFGSYTPALASITPATLTLDTPTVLDKVYDTTPRAQVAGGAFTAHGLVAGDAVSFAGLEARFGDSNVGSGKPVTVGGSLAGTDSGNYQLVLPTGLHASITPATLTLDTPAVLDKVYDATTLAQLAGGPVTLRGVLGDDTVAVGGIDARFGDKNVGSGKAVTLSATLSGTDAGNYRVQAPTGLAASITPATLAWRGLVANDRDYNGTTVATVSGAGVQGVLGSDSVSLVAGSASFADPNAGERKTVTLAGFGLGGADAANYRLAAAPSLQATIRPKPLTIAADNLNKSVGDLLTFTGTEFTAQGLVGAEKVDAVTLASAGAAADAKSGAYPITPGNPVVGSNGFRNGNYAISFQNGALAVFDKSTPPAVVQVNNQVLTFTQLFVQEARAQQSADAPHRRKDKDGRGDDIVSSDNACRQ